MTTGNPKIILLDMDGVICDIDQYVLDLYQEKYPNLPFIPLSQRKSQSSEQEYREKFGDQAGDAMASFFKGNIPNFFANLPPFTKAVAAIKNKLLTNKNYQVFFCTSPLLQNPTCASDKIKWIEKIFGFEASKRVIICMDKTLITGDLIIDDKPIFSGIFSKNNGCQPKFGKQVLMRCCHNRHINVGDDDCQADYILEEDWENLDEIFGEIFG